MKKMVYGNIGKKIELIERSKYQGYDYAILNIHGSHPCCYVKLPFEHRLAKIALDNYDELDIRCHGGITYAENYLRLSGQINEDGTDWINGARDFTGVWIGWDYAHCDDYRYDPFFNREPIAWEHKWTYEELLEDVKSVIDQIVEGDIYVDETSGV